MVEGREVVEVGRVEGGWRVEEWRVEGGGRVERVEGGREVERTCDDDQDDIRELLTYSGTCRRAGGVRVKPSQAKHPSSQAEKQPSRREERQERRRAPC